MNDLTKRSLIDNFGRRFSYLRLSVTDICNFRCTYCLPSGYKKNNQSFLSVVEIKNLAAAFAEMGISKIRLTGGEPTVRKDFIDIAESISSLKNIKNIALITNGYCLKKYAKDFAACGISAINISIDSLNKENFKNITDHDKLSLVLDGVQEALNVGIKAVKINTVLLKEINDSELDSFISFVKDKPIALRFIELMRTGDNADYFFKHHLKSDFIQEQLEKRGWKKLQRESDSGPAIEYFHPCSKGRIGIIAPYSKSFCSGCNRLRVTARGDLRLCLFGSGSYNLKPLLQNENQKEDLKNKVAQLLNLKTSSHLLHLGKTGLISNLASLGG